MRLIDADEMIKGICFIIEDSKELLTSSVVRKAMLGLVDRIKTVDAAPVVHARWEMDYSWHGHCRCSNCYGTSIEAEWLNRYMWPYCPNCGAKMDGGEA